MIGLTIQLDQPTDLINSFEKIVIKKEKTVTKKSCRQKMKTGQGTFYISGNFGLSTIIT